MTVHEDLHTRLEALPDSVDVGLERTFGGWRCQIYARDADGLYGEATGDSAAEAIEGALDDAAENEPEKGKRP